MKSTAWLSLTLILFFTACRKHQQAVPPSPPLLRDIAGTIQLYDEFGKEYPYNIGVTVVLSNDSLADSATTIQGGKYIFEKVPSGTYNLIVSKDNFGTEKKFDIVHSFTADSASIPLQLAPAKLFMRSTSVVTYYAALGDPEGGFSFNVAVTPNPSSGQQRHVRFFVGADSLVSYEHYDAFGPTLGLSKNGTHIHVSQNVLTDIGGYTSGQKVYLRVYGDAPGSEYFDIPSSNYIYPCLNSNTQPAASFIVP